MKLVAATVGGVAVLDEEGVRTTLENDVRVLAGGEGARGRARPNRLCPEHQIRAIVSAGDTVYVGLGNGEVLRSPDWERLPFAFEGLRALAVDRNG